MFVVLKVQIFVKRDDHLAVLRATNLLSQESVPIFYQRGIQIIH